MQKLNTTTIITISSMGAAIMGSNSRSSINLTISTMMRLGLSGRLPKLKSRKRSRKQLFATILIRIWMMLRRLKRSFRRFPLHTKCYQTQRHAESMINQAQRASRNMNRGKTQDKAVAIMISLGVISTSTNKWCRSFSRTQTS